ncbi:hypothetical protein DPX16_14176 [Anabarilius grahami]|uniref:Uncharacterized protein n=1 Tax=Anabarilius grahami TaxID=495550 RepID=A0A3N0XF21_ANAGA|nr:hypothetical protein DPX16_14176 [Anabarilius grahami]
MPFRTSSWQYLNSQSECSDADSTFRIGEKKADEDQLQPTVQNTLRKLSRPTNKNCPTADRRLGINEENPSFSMRFLSFGLLRILTYNTPADQHALLGISVQNSNAGDRH